MAKTVCVDSSSPLHRLYSFQKVLPTPVQARSIEQGDRSVAAKYGSKTTTRNICPSCWSEKVIMSTRALFLNEHNSVLLGERVARKWTLNDLLTQSLSRLRYVLWRTKLRREIGVEGEESE